MAALLSSVSLLAAKRVALVVDDGPSAAQTERFLKVLQEADVKVTFSYVGREVTANPALAKAAAKAGHDFCNHSNTHPHLKTLDDAAVRDELQRGTAAIEKAIGRPPSFFWAPYLEHDERVDRLSVETTKLEHFPLDRVHFVSSDDWNVDKTDAATLYRNATTGVQDLTVILFHEWRKETVDQMPAILTELKRQGCTFLTFSEIVKLIPAK